MDIEDLLIESARDLCYDDYVMVLEFVQAEVMHRLESLEKQKGKGFFGK